MQNELEMVKVMLQVLRAISLVLSERQQRKCRSPVRDLDIFQTEQTLINLIYLPDGVDRKEMTGTKQQKSVATYRAL